MSDCIKVSFLIPVYNQPDELIECVSRIIKYNGREIEIVIQDDCSKVDVFEHIDKLEDNRIRYFRNGENIGQDGAILNGIENCKGEFVFLLRTNDYIIAEAIPHLLNSINDENVVFLTASCVDENSFPYILYKEDCIYKKGLETLYIHEKLYNHPSGFLFRRDAIDTDYIKYYQGGFIDPNMSVIVGQLIRLYLTQKGDFKILRDINWVYFQNPKRMRHKSANVVKNKKFIYDSSYIYDRYRIEMQMAFDYLTRELSSYELSLIFDRYINYVTYGKKDWSEDDGFLEHYNLSGLYVDLDSERNRFIDFSSDIEEKIGINSAMYCHSKEKSINKNIEFDYIDNQMRNRREYVKKMCEPIVTRIYDNRTNGIGIGSSLRGKGYTAIGLYGAGYLGKIIWNELLGSNVKIVFICDKNFKTEYKIPGKCKIIPPENIGDYNIDALVVTPIQSVNEIINSINCKAPVISVEGLLV